MRSWVFASGSLTRHLKSVCGSNFRVQVLRQSFADPFPDERRLLHMRRGRWALVREVTLFSGSGPLVLARSVLPLETLRGAGRRLAHLGNRPLGEFLFSCRDLERVRFEVAEVDCSCWHPNIGSEYGLAGETWGRRSLYALAGRSLLVAEFFLPPLSSLPGRP
jgi:chorismate--pyruvate lyase